jgi:hypothetical protein
MGAGKVMALNGVMLLAVVAFDPGAYAADPATVWYATAPAGERSRLLGVYKQALEAHGRQDHAALKRAAEVFFSAFKEYTELNFDPELGRARAHLFFLMLEPHYDAFKKTRPSLPLSHPPSHLQAGLKKKLGELKTLELMYLSVIAQLGDSEERAAKKDYRWAQACLLRIAQLHLDMYDTLLDAPFPAGLAALDERGAERLVQLRFDSAEPLLVLAEVFFILAVQANEGAETEWRDQAIEQLAELQSCKPDHVLKNLEARYEALDKVRDGARTSRNKLIKGAPASLAPWTQPGKALGMVD